MRIVILVALLVPALGGHVDTTTKCDGVVHHDDLLMVRGTARVVRIEPEVEAALRKPVQKIKRGRATYQRSEQTETPLHALTHMPPKRLQHGL